jgi:hypothetical protein
MNNCDCFVCGRYGPAVEMKAKAEEDGSGGMAGGDDDPDDPYADVIAATRQKVRHINTACVV